VSNLAQHRQLVQEHAASLERFIMHYIVDRGVSAFMVEVIARQLLGQPGATGPLSQNAVLAPKQLLAQVTADLVHSEALGDYHFDLEAVINGAASLAYVVRVARQVEARIIPPDVIPDDEVVDAALALFHASRTDSLI